MSRANIPEKDRRDFALYVDEFQNFSTDSFATILSEARKYHLNLIVANQFTTQLTEEVRDAVFGNIGTIVAFRVGQDEDAEAIAKRMRPAFDVSDLLRMPNYNAAVRTLIGGVPTQPFSMATLPPLGNPNPKLADALKQLAAAKYGRPKGIVEKEIFERLATKAPEPAPAMGGFGSYGAGAGGLGGGGGFGASPAAGGFGSPAGAMGAGARPMPPAPGTGNFLDEWMTKRSGPLQLRPSPWSAPPANRIPAASAPTAASAVQMPAAAPYTPPASPMTFSQPPAAMPGPAPTAPAPMPPTMPAQAPAQPAPMPATATPTGGLQHGDTIYIDQDGTLHNR
jgi:type IV secretory system conjugative DNA transfer VirD4/TraG family protein